ncbi:TPA: hypothetical protein ACPZRY_002691 [Yersinia enterocolitica]|uniref:hypothetical protein n=1 Tax=Yersinia enterocolitica TaxID=630 RepID=UPI0032FE9338|nr:hypothetical protein [Yersinia enterocolitica]EKN4810476.1 hypothetical protein [Yersinia enterocolitica]HDL7329207.1 hypothetical protein [Yersinia enterocolitica]HDL7354758.1 hypothetical protein [Yersinia enterocolitica]HDL7959373.1 hypothetical protein [Yersinia enterocolitica]
MKKTLLSIMTMAILASGSASAVTSLSIDVSATVPSNLKMVPATGGSNLTQAVLIPDPNNLLQHQYKETVTLTANNGNKSINIKVKNPLLLEHTDDATQSLNVNTVTLGNQSIQQNATPVAAGVDIDVTGGAKDVELVISAQALPESTVGVYKGVLALELSESA